MLRLVALFSGLEVLVFQCLSFPSLFPLFFFSRPFFCSPSLSPSFARVTVSDVATETVGPVFVERLFLSSLFSSHSPPPVKSAAGWKKDRRRAPGGRMRPAALFVVMRYGTLCGGARSVVLKCVSLAFSSTDMVVVARGK